MKVSRRGESVPASPIRKLAPYADAAKANGTEIFHLNIGQPDIPSPPKFWDAVKGFQMEVLEYGPSPGLPELRKAMAENYQGLGIDVTPEEVMVTTAGSEALLFAIKAICDPGDEVIVPEPMYANYIGFAESANVSVVPITTSIEDGFALPSAEEIESRITDRTRAILINNPGNPTGTIYTNDQMQALRDICLRRDIYLVSDEVYRDFNYTGERITSVLELEGMDEHAVMIDSSSKRFSLCGARIGFLVTRNAAVNDIALRISQARLCPPTLEQVGMLAALETPASYFDEIREEYRTRRDVVVSRLRGMQGVTCPDIQGAFYATARLPVDDADNFCQWMLEKFTWGGKTVMLAPGSGFYATEGLGKQEARIAYVLNTKRLEQAMDCLAQALADYPNR